MKKNSFSETASHARCVRNIRNDRFRRLGMGKGGGERSEVRGQRSEGKTKAEIWKAEMGKARAET
jgi:hypothetical protein